MYLVPSEFFVASASATSDVSDLNAFDKALIKMGIGEQNLVPVSSVIPIGAKEVPAKKLPMGAVTHCVLSYYKGYEGESIAAGIAYAFRKDGKGGYVAEARGSTRGNFSGDFIMNDLEQKMNEIADSRGVEMDEIKCAVAYLTIPKGQRYGACVAALVFTRYE